jgi:F420-non-reducing hydrogenase iron-sulfur subunit
MKQPDDNERKVIAFGCEKWGYSVADLTGTTRKSYSSNFHLIKVKCTGRVGIHLIMQAFLNGADGVAIISCHEGECDYGSANMNTYGHVMQLKKIFKDLGINEERIQQYFCAAAEVEKFVQSVNDICQKVQILSPLPKHKLNPN